jgi:succinate dehydrogenase / fumarate reductase cytochrome b subunit
MSLIVTAYRSTVGKKIVMAVSGLILVGFVLTHMLGNLKVFGGINPATGRYKIDEYGETLRQIGEQFLGHEGFLWMARLVLLLAVCAHAWSGIALAAINRRARPVPYQVQRYGSSNAASRTMLYGGILLMVFVIFHILDLTVGAVHPSFQEGKVYANLSAGFAIWYRTLFYVVAMGALSLHLYHGTWSMFQTLGVDNPRWNGGIRMAAKTVAILLFIGFSAVPVSFALGLMSAPM